MFGSGFELNGPWSVLEALAVLASIIAVHEWGHFTAARLQGIHVTQFAIGFGPPLISFKVGMGSGFACDHNAGFQIRNSSACCAADL
jgi:hypothetical protein